MMIKEIALLLLLTVGLATFENRSHAAAQYEDGLLSVPYLEFDNQLYSLELELISAGETIDFVLTNYASLNDTMAPPSNTAYFSDSVLFIPTLRVGIETYQVQLDLLESTGVFRMQNAPAPLLASTDGVYCDYSDSTPNSSASLTITSVSDWHCADGSRNLVANGIPDHPVGTFPNPANPNTITEQSVSASLPLEPVETGVTRSLGGPSGPVGFVLNGVKIDPGTGGTCDNSGEYCSLGGGGGGWHIEALGQSSFDFGEDHNNAHVQPSGEYHYHGIPEGFVDKQDGSSDSMTLIGWAADGFPIYARYGYSISDNDNSPLKVIEGSYELVGSVPASRPSVDIYPLGTFSEDWVFVEGSGDLDQCNGRFGVTPEFPNGIYHYYATDSYPYFQRCVTGQLNDSDAGGPPPQALEATYQEGVISIPVLDFDGLLYSIELELVTDNGNLNFIVSRISVPAGNAQPPLDIATFSNGVLSIPALRVGSDTYEVALSFLESEGVFRFQGNHDHDGSDDSHTHSEGLNLDLYYSGALVDEPTIQDCILSNGTATTCYAITIAGYPVNHEVGPFCPATTSAGPNEGGIWFDGNGVYDIDGAFILGLAELYGDSNWKLYDADGNVRITDTPEAFDAAARPDVDPAYQNYCVEGRIEWLENSEPVTTTVLIPSSPVTAEYPTPARGNLGVTLNGVIIAGAAPVDAILGAYTIAAFDDCGGHINPFEGYHLHGARGCSEVGQAEEGETPIFAYALDGYPIHSPYEADAEPAAGLDTCNGHTTEAYGYHYHAASAEENGVLNCFSGLTVQNFGPGR